MKLRYAKWAHKKAIRKLIDYLTLIGKVAEAGVEAAAPFESDLNGVALRDLNGVIENSHEVLGEGGYGRVLAVDIAGCPPLCVKIIFDEDLVEETLQEAQYMLALQDVSGIPCVLGISESPLALLMTRHGTHTLFDVARGRTEGLKVSVSQVF